MTDVRAGVVDVYVIRPIPGDWRVLALRRSDTVTRATAWETVHGTIEPGERPPTAAHREVAEETGLAVSRLYNVTCQAFYLHTIDTVQIAIVFAAFVEEPAEVSIGTEHQAWEWLTLDEASRRFVWPREREALGHIQVLLAAGHAGPVEDVLRVQ